VVGCANTHSLQGGDLVTVDCDILVPAALENQIRADNVADVKAKLIVEGANGPITPAADRALVERGIPVLPDILANAGGVTVSYFEWVQNNQNEQWELERVNEQLEQKMRRATDAVLKERDRICESLEEIEAQLEETRKKREVPPGPLGPPDLRTAAFVLAISRVSSVALERGIWP
jgi:glutamate dehydrogenase/leucine dehydrogenase